MRINGFVPDDSIFKNVGNNENKIENESSFGDVFKGALDKLNEKQVQADDITNRFVMGEDIEVHEMMLATEEAEMSLQLAVQMRNKIVEAVQELTRMQL